MSATTKSRIFRIGHGAVLEDGTTVRINHPVNFYVGEGILYDRCLIPGFFQTLVPPVQGFTFDALCGAEDIANRHTRLTLSGTMKEHLFYSTGDNFLVCPKFRISPSADTSGVIASNIANQTENYSLTSRFPFLQAPMQGTIDDAPVRCFSFKDDSPFTNDIAIVPDKPIGQQIKAIKLGKIAEWADTVYNRAGTYELEFHWLACRASVNGTDSSKLTMNADD